MKLVRNLLDSIKPHFEKGGKLEKLQPAFDAFETFAFVPGHTAHSGAHIRDGIDLKRTMINVVLALMPPLFFGMWNVGYQHFLALGIESDLMQNMIFGAGKVLPIIIVSYVSGLTVEFAFAVIKKHQINEGFLVTGMLIPLVMPVTIPLWMVAVATVFAVVIGKEVFGGTGMNLLNPALVARCFLFFAYPAAMSGEIWNDLSLEAGQSVADGYSGATTLALIDNLEKGGFNSADFPSVAEMFFGTIQGSIGETSVLAILIGAGILLFTGIGSWRIMLSMVAGALAMGFLFNALAPAGDLNHPMHLPAYYHLLMGGFAFGCVYMATDPVTAAQTNTGKWIYGFLAGVFAVVLRIINPAYPEGVMLSILFLNVFAPLIDYFVVQANINKRLSRA